MRKKLAAAVLAAFIFTGCASMARYKKIDAFVLSGDYKAADGVVEKEKKSYANEHELLYYFDKGLILQLMGDYGLSTEYLNKAELKIESLYTKSVTKHLSSFFTNDTTLPYEGEDFEQVMVHVLKALNFMYTGNYSGAQIEARKVNHRLNLLADRYEGKPIYQEDAFARYLGGAAYEAAGELDHARIDYTKSYNAYLKYDEMYGTPVPLQVKKDLLRVLSALRYHDDVKAYKEKWGNIDFTSYSEMEKKAEVIVVIYDGLAPYKISRHVSSPVKDDKGNVHVIKVAFPYFKQRGYAVAGASLETQSGPENSFVAEDISAIAVKNLEHKNGLIKAKAVARAAAKYFASKAISDNGKNKLLGMFANVYSLASEQADTRSWRVLPARFHVIRAVVPPGKNRLKVKVNLAGGGVRDEIVEVNIKKGEKKAVPIFVFN